MFGKHYCESLPDNLVWLRGVKEVSPEEGKFKLRFEGYMKGILATAGERVREKHALGREDHTGDIPKAREGTPSLRS